MHFEQGGRRISYSYARLGADRQRRVIADRIPAVPPQDADGRGFGVHTSIISVSSDQFPRLSRQGGGGSRRHFDGARAGGDRGVAVLAAVVAVPAVYADGQGAGGPAVGELGGGGDLDAAGVEHGILTVARLDSDRRGVRIRSEAVVLPVYSAAAAAGNIFFALLLGGCHKDVSFIGHAVVAAVGVDADGIAPLAHDLCPLFDEDGVGAAAGADCIGDGSRLDHDILSMGPAALFAAEGRRRADEPKQDEQAYQ